MKFCSRLRMAATEHAVWFVPEPWGTPVLARRRHHSHLPPEVHNNATCVAATENAVFFGSAKGIYQFSTEGKLVRQYGHKGASFPTAGFSTCAKEAGKSTSPSEALRQWRRSARPCHR